MDTLVTTITNGISSFAGSHSSLFELSVAVTVAIVLKSLLSKKYTEESVKIIQAVAGIEKTLLGYHEKLMANSKDIKNILVICSDFDKRIDRLEQKSNIIREKECVNTLIVDDQEEVATHLQDYIKARLSEKEKFSPFIFDTDVVNSYDDAIKKLKLTLSSEKKYDVIITDINLGEGKLGWDIGKYCEDENITINSRDNKPNILYFSGDSTFNIPADKAEKFITLEENILSKPLTDGEWIIFENRLLEAIK